MDPLRLNGVARPTRCALLASLVLLTVWTSLLLVSCREEPGRSTPGKETGSRLRKTGRTFYTDERIAVGRKNIARAGWGDDLRRRIFETGDSIGGYIGPEYTAADLYAAQTDGSLWLLQPPTTIPRVIDPRASVARCPQHGETVRSVDPNCPWRIDPIAHPYRIQCPIGGEWYPSNRYDQGNLTSGAFPDDGNGFVVDGIRYFPLREYCHMVYGTVVIPTLRSLSQAYLLTGDRRYAHKGCVLLARLATVYPNYGWEGDDPTLENRFDRTYLGPWNNQHPYYAWKRGGLITDCIWECLSLDALAYVYDAFYDYLDDDPDLIRFVRDRGLMVKDGKELRGYIETYILRSGMRAIKAKWVTGNEGHHQSAALALALVLDDHSSRHPNSADLVDYAYFDQGQAAYILVNGLTRDGGGYESPSYNLYNLRFIAVARCMEELRRRHPALYPVQRYPDIFAGPKARALFDYYIDMVQQDHRLPSIGDEGGITPPTRRTGYAPSVLTHENVFAATRYRDPRFAVACTDENGGAVPGELWEPYPEKEIRAIREQHGDTIRRESRFLDGYGVMILESSGSRAKTTLALNYTSLRNHGQADRLAIGLIKDGVDLLPDLGYPVTWDYRKQWDGNSLAHNTVTVDETQPDYWSIRGRGRLFASSAGVHLAVATHDPYPGGLRAGARPVRTFERGVLLVETEGGDPYVVDLFLVDGGEQHDQSWHGMLTRVQDPDLAWVPQARGTLAGPGVVEFAGYTDRWGREHPAGDFPSYLTHVRRATLERPARWRWSSGLAEGDFLDLYLLPLDGPAEVIQATGRSPVWQDRDLDYVILRRRARGGSLSRFLTVLAPGQGRSTALQVELLSQNPLRLEVKHGDTQDRIEFTLGRADPGVPAALVGVRVERTAVGGRKQEIRIGEREAGRGDGYVRSQIVAVDRDHNAIVCRWDGADTGSGAGATAFVSNAVVRLYNEQRSSLWRIEKASRDGSQVRLQLDRTSLAAFGPVSRMEDGIVYLAAGLPLATSAIDSQGLSIRQDAYAGMVLEGGSDAVRIDAATQPGVVVLAEPVPVSRLRACMPDGIARIYEYGVGDSIELARVEVRTTGW